LILTHLIASMQLIYIYLDTLIIQASIFLPDPIIKYYQTRKYMLSLELLEEMLIRSHSTNSLKLYNPIDQSPIDRINHCLHQELLDT